MTRIKTKIFRIYGSLGEHVQTQPFSRLRIAIECAYSIQREHGFQTISYIHTSPIISESFMFVRAMYIHTQIRDEEVDRTNHVESRCEWRKKIDRKELKCHSAVHM